MFKTFFNTDDGECSQDSMFVFTFYSVEMLKTLGPLKKGEHYSYITVDVEEGTVEWQQGSRSGRFPITLKEAI